MKTEIKSYHSFDVEDLESYQPEISDNFRIGLRIIVGPANTDGGESFDVEICTPKWLLDNCKRDEIIMGRHKLIVFEYNYNRITRWINEYVGRCSGDTWTEIAPKLARLGFWEFEDYRS